MHHEHDVQFSQRVNVLKFTRFDGQRWFHRQMHILAEGATTNRTVGIFVGKAEPLNKRTVSCIT